MPHPRTSSVQVIVVDVAGTDEVREWAADQLFAKLQQAGGLLTVVGLREGLDLWVNDEVTDLLELNPTATLLANHYGHCHVLFGPVVITAGLDADGTPLSFEADESEFVHTLLASMTARLG